jgi:hypothetical protein
VTTEDLDGGNHDVYFNRGAAASQEYARRFKNQRPSEPAHFAWLSRGCHEAIVAFIALARNSGWSLRVAAYEFHEKGVLDALRQAKKRKVDVQIVYDRRQDKPGRKNDAAVKKAGLQAQCTRRKATKSAIAHNKFIVLLKGSKAIAVLTGGTNFSEGGIFGHSNAVHIVEMPKIADAYLAYWKLLDADPENAALRPDVTASFDVPADLPPAGTRAVFSPRSSDDALQWYGTLAASAKDGLFATFAFGMHEVFQVHADRSARRRSDSRGRLGELQQGVVDRQRREHARHPRQPPRRRDLSRRVHAALQSLRLPRMDRVGRAPADATPQHLRTNDWWKQYFGNTERSRQREYFASA